MTLGHKLRLLKSKRNVCINEISLKRNLQRVVSLLRQVQVVLKIKKSSSRIRPALCYNFLLRCDIFSSNKIFIHTMISTLSELSKLVDREFKLRN